MMYNWLQLPVFYNPRNKELNRINCFFVNFQASKSFDFLWHLKKKKNESFLLQPIIQMAGSITVFIMRKLVQRLKNIKIHLVVKKPTDFQLKKTC